MRERREIPLAEVRLEGACEYISIQGMEMYTAAQEATKQIRRRRAGHFRMRQRHWEAF